MDEVTRWIGPAIVVIAFIAPLIARARRAAARAMEAGDGPRLAPRLVGAPAAARRIVSQAPPRPAAPPPPPRAAPAPSPPPAHVLAASRGGTALLDTLRRPSGMRQAVILAELMRPPLAFRSFDDR